MFYHPSVQTFPMKNMSANAFSAHISVFEFLQTYCAIVLNFLFNGMFPVFSERNSRQKHRDYIWGKQFVFFLFLQTNKN